MGTTENVDLVRRGYEAFNAGDMTSLSEMFAEDAVWYAAGSGVLSGTKRGRDAILAFFGELGARTQGHFKANLKDVVGGDNHTVAIQQTQATRGEKSIDVGTVITFVIRDGKIAEGREYFEDTAKYDDFWV
ncbi:MAG: nuclear transport factor 2 family protein [Pseudarthrobacter sp.]